MIQVTREDCEAGMKMARLVGECPDSLDCLWSHKECRRNCILVDFRRMFERQSPAFFGVFRRISEYNAILEDLARMEIEGNADEQFGAKERFDDLQLWAQAVVFALYSLYRANHEEIPFLNNDELKKIEEDYLKRDFKGVYKELEGIDPQWFRWAAGLINRICDRGSWAKKWYLLVRIFIEGVEKDALPARFTSEEDKEAFFKEIENLLFSGPK